MARIKRGLASHRKHKKLLESAKGYWMSRHKLVRKATEAVLHAGQYAYVGRKDKKPMARKSWILHINEALKLEGLKYSRFIKLLKDQKIELDRKVMSELAIEQPEVFKKFLAFTASQKRG